jgi:hypothetical protein
MRSYAFGCLQLRYLCVCVWVYVCGCGYLCVYVCVRAGVGVCVDAFDARKHKLCSILKASALWWRMYACMYMSLCIFVCALSISVSA